MKMEVFGQEPWGARPPAIGAAAKGETKGPRLPWRAIDEALLRLRNHLGVVCELPAMLMHRPALQDEHSRAAIRARKVTMEKKRGRETASDENQFEGFGGIGAHDGPPVVTGFAPSR